MLEVLKSFDDGQREVLDQIFGSIIGNDGWKQSSLPINLSGLGVRQSQKRLSAQLQPQTNWSTKNKKASLRKKNTFKELHQSLEPFNLLSHTQKKIQET